MKYFIYILIVISISACNNHLVKTYVDKPAKVDIFKYDNIVVGEFLKSDNERDFELESTIKSMFLKHSNQNIIDLDYIRNKNNNISDSILNSLLILKANIIHKDIYTRGDFTVGSDKENHSKTRQLLYYYDVIYEVSFTLSEYKSGRIIYETTLKQTDEGDIYYTGKQDLNINKSRYFSVMKNKLADRLFKEIFPSKVFVNIIFKKYKTNFDKGISYAEKGQLASAKNFFENLVKNTREEEELSYAYTNLGVCNLYMYDFDNAEYYFNQSNKLIKSRDNDNLISLTREMKYKYENEYSK